MTVWAVQNTVMVPQKISWQGKEESRSQEAPVLLSETVKEGIWTLHRLALGLDKPCVIKPENLNPYKAIALSRVLSGLSEDLIHPHPRGHEPELQNSSHTDLDKISLVLKLHYRYIHYISIKISNSALFCKKLNCR